jgi:hypothetical protein
MRTILYRGSCHLREREPFGHFPSVFSRMIKQHVVAEPWVLRRGLKADM